MEYKIIPKQEVGLVLELIEGTTSDFYQDITTKLQEFYVEKSIAISQSQKLMIQNVPSPDFESYVLGKTKLEPLKLIQVTPKFKSLGLIHVDYHKNKRKVKSQNELNGQSTNVINSEKNLELSQCLKLYFYTKTPIIIEQHLKHESFISYNMLERNKFLNYLEDKLY